MKKVILALLAATAITAGLATVADAKTSFRIYLGEPYYNSQISPDYQYYNGRGWHRPMQRYRISCREARQIVRDKGFRNVSTRECEGRTYTFSAMRRGNPTLVYVNSRTGAVWRG